MNSREDTTSGTTTGITLSPVARQRNAAMWSAAHMLFCECQRLDHAIKRHKLESLIRPPAEDAMMQFIGAMSSDNWEEPQRPGEPRIPRALD